MSGGCRTGSAAAFLGLWLLGCGGLIVKTYEVGRLLDRHPDYPAPPLGLHPGEDPGSSREEVSRKRRLEKLNSLDGNELSQTTSRYLTKSEIKALMTRRDKIVAYFQKLISEMGESEVLY